LEFELLQPTSEFPELSFSLLSFISQSPSFFFFSNLIHKVQKLKQNPNPKTLFPPESKASTFTPFLKVGHKKIRRNVAAVLHSGFLYSSSDPLCATNQKLKSVCGNNGICCQRIKKLQEQGLSSPTSSLVKDVGFHALQQQHKVDLSNFMN